MPAYRVSARRHLGDADHLFAHGRHVTADHLAGFSAECSIKALLCGPLGVAVPKAGAPKAGQTQFGHLPPLWANAASYLQGQTVSTVPQLNQLLASANPFSAWSVGDRYEDGSDIGAGRVSGHLAAARQLLGVVDQVVLSGLPVA